MLPTQAKGFMLDEEVLAVSLELSKGSWKLALHDGKRDKPTIHTVSIEEASKRLQEVAAVLEEVKKKWKLTEQIRVVVMYEAGQDGLWIRRDTLLPMSHRNHYSFPCHLANHMVSVHLYPEQIVVYAQHERVSLVTTQSVRCG